MEKLLKEEKLVINCLKIYSCLRWEQLMALMPNKPEETAQKILVGLKKRQYIVEDEAGYVKLDPRTEPNQKTISAFWILLKYFDKINPDAHYAADYPSEIFFLRDNVQYEIVVLNPNEENLIKMLFLENRNSSDAEEDAIKYIIVVPETGTIEKCLKNIPEKVLENKQVMFATVDYNFDTGKPNIQYYKV